MATNYTTNYQLCQWEANDKVLRSDFNADNQKIDAALKAKGNCILYWGSYTGTGEYGPSHPNTLTADFVPVAALICGDRDGGSKSSAFLVRGCTYYEVVYSGSQGIHVSWQNNSLSWYGDNVGSQLNDPNTTYSYLLIGYDQAGNT